MHAGGACASGHAQVRPSVDGRRIWGLSGLPVHRNSGRAQRTPAAGSGFFARSRRPYCRASLQRRAKFRVLGLALAKGRRVIGFRRGEGGAFVEEPESERRSEWPDAAKLRLTHLAID